MYPTEECLLVKEFQEIWNRDKSKDKEKALKELSYIEFKHSYLDTNPYSEYSEDIKEHKILEDLFDDKWVPDKVVQAAEEKYKEFRDNASVSLRYYLSNLRAAEELIDFLDTVDLQERTKGGTAVYKPTDISRALKEANDVLAALQKLKLRVQKENYESSKTKGNKQINTFEK